MRRPETILKTSNDRMGKSLDDHKAAMRSVARHQRRVLQQAQGITAALAVCDHVLKAPFITGGGVVAAYWPTGDEMDTRPLLEMMAGRDIICALPVIVGPGQPLIFRRWQPDTPLVTGRFDVQIPDQSNPVVTPRIVLTPLLAFDQAGYRLGYGGGYYDRSLAWLRRQSAAVIACGLAFSGQEVKAIPHDAHDQRLDWIVTEKGVRPVPSLGDSGTIRANHAECGGGS